MSSEIFQISEEQRTLELKDRWKSHCNEFTSRSVDEDETDLLYKIWITTALLWMAMTFTWTSQPYSVSVTLYRGARTENESWQLQMSFSRRSKICPPKFTKREGYGKSESTWEPVHAIVHDDGNLNHVFVDYCLAHAPRFDTALRQARRISGTLKKKSTARNPTNTLPGTGRSKKRSVLRRFHSSVVANGDVQKNLKLVVWQKTGYLE